jgi:hypothetical protein
MRWEFLLHDFKENNMSAYNTIIFPWKDPESNKSYDLLIQFKYGEVWQHEYKVGDLLKWGANDVGDHSAKKVVVEGVLEGEKLTDKMPEDFEIYIVNNKIENVLPSTHNYDFSKTDNDYLILE